MSIAEIKLKRKVEEYIQDLLAMEIEWQTAFGTTYRKNGDVVTGSLRDTLDEEGLKDSLYVIIRRGGISIGFSDKAAKYIFDEERGRPEFWDYVLTRMPGDLAVLVAKYEIYKKLGSKFGRRTKIN